MLRWCDLAAIISALMGAILGGGAAASHKAGVWEVVLFALGGLIVGVMMGMASGRLADKALDQSIRQSRRSKNVTALLLSLLYFTVPLISILVVGAGMLFLTEWLVKVL